MNDLMEKFRQARTDINHLLAIVREHQETTGQCIDEEDAVLVKEIERRNRL